VWYACHAICPLVDFTPENGATRVVPGSHRNPHLVKGKGKGAMGYADPDKPHPLQLGGTRGPGTWHLAPEEADQRPEDGDALVLLLLARGDTAGVSQLETPGPRRLLRQVRPDSQLDLARVLALARPGAGSGGGRETYLRRRHGQERVSYPHPCLEPALRDTLGLLLFEDDAITTVELLCDLPAGEADLLRRRLADGDTADEAARQFTERCEQTSVPQPAAEQVLGMLRRQEAYTFNKAHAWSFSRICWRQLWMKARHPLAFWTACLNQHEGRFGKWVYCECIKRAGLALHGPCINRSALAWTQEVSGLRAGLSAVRSLTPTAASAVIEERQQGGVFASLAEFRRRLQVQVRGQDLALLIRAGAFDFTGRGRQALLREAEAGRAGRLPAWWIRRHGIEPWPGLGLPESVTQAERWRAEWELLGFLPGPPLMTLLRSALPAGLDDSRSVEQAAPGSKVRLAGLVAQKGEGKPVPLALMDEWGMVDVDLPAGTEGPSEADLVLVEGKVESVFGAPVVKAAQVGRCLASPAGASPVSRNEAASAA
jgi:DNA polymerase-3 subunit alpha